jgi:hypothetical protein
MAEVWKLYTADGQVYNFNVQGNDPNAILYDDVYNLLIGTTGHHGLPYTILSDPVPNIAGAEFRQRVGAVRPVYLPLRITGQNPADFHRNFERIRNSITQVDEHQLWVTNEEGETRVLYCRYLKGFETTVDDDKRSRLTVNVPLYVEADDPYWYAPPGAEISQSFSSEPWNSDFLTFTEEIALSADAATGDTRLTVTNTENCEAGFPIEIQGSKAVLGLLQAELLADKEKETEDELSLSVQSSTNITVSTEQSNVQLNQTFHVSGTLTSQSQNVSNTMVSIQETDPNGVTTSSISFTSGTGTYYVTKNLNINGIYTYVASFLGSGSLAPSTASTSITVGTVAATTLTLTVSPGNPAVSTNFTLSGTLKAGGVGVLGQTVTIYKNSPRGKTKIASATTDKNGAYSFTRKETTAGWVSYLASYAGDTVTTIAKQDPSLSTWLTWLFQKIFGELEGQVTYGSFAASSASLIVAIGTFTYHINYMAGLPPSMINDGEIQYFGYNGFMGIICIAEAGSDNYSTELGVITGQGLWPAIDISVVTNNDTALSVHHTWLASLYAAGWRYFMGGNSHGRTGDPAYIASLGAGAVYINDNSSPRGTGTTQPDISGTGVYHNSFDCYNSKSIPYIETYTTSAYLASPSVKSGLTAYVRPDDSSGINGMLTNSVAGTAPTYRDIFDWSYVNQTGMTNFVVWFGPKYNAITARDSEPEQLSLYKSLQFDLIISELASTYYPGSNQLDMAGTHYVWTQPTHKAVSLTMNYTTSPAGTCEFTGTLTELNTGIAVASATVTLWEDVTGTWTQRATTTTDSAGNYDIPFTSTVGIHTFRIMYAGDATHMAFTAPSAFGITMNLCVVDLLSVKEMNEIYSIDSPTVLTLVNPLANNYTVASEAYLVEVDTEDCFLTPDPSTTRTVNPNCTLLQMWIPGCPPCYNAMAQLNALVADYPSVTYLHANITEQLPYGPSNNFYPYNEPGDIGMNAVAIQYPSALQFARPKSEGGQCGPALPAWGPMTVIDDIMPTVIALYRNGLFITAWCGVHTTGVDPVSTDTILDACGPMLTWRLGQSYIGSQVIVNNNGDVIAYPIWTFTGPGRSPTLTNVTTGDVFQLNHDLVAGEAVVIDATENAHTVASTNSATFTGAGYMKSETCPTCHGTGVIPSGCATCGGWEICPTCHGSGVISVWVPASTGSTTDIGGMNNLRFEMDPNGNTFWGFQPGANVITVEMGVATYNKSIANLSLVQRYEGI